MDFTVYLAGMMETAANNGAAWRSVVQPKLEDAGMKTFNPCNLEVNPVLSVGFDSVQQWKDTKNINMDRYLEGQREIIFYDLDILDKCACVLVYIEPNMTGGTLGEVTHAYRNLGIPVFGVLAPGLEPKSVGGWMLGCVTEFCEDLDNAVEKICQYKELSEFITDNPDWIGCLDKEVKGKE